MNYISSGDIPKVHIRDAVLGLSGRKFGHYVNAHEQQRALEPKWRIGI
ncbi:hypothetical protein J7382_04375 [Shimia sp. R11_0]|nr:hypothetical protein [Shimia sp. R11_0]MBO9476766.1 hypothetical protein [Shimia sp. R11_0]